MYGRKYPCSGRPRVNFTFSSFVFGFKSNNTLTIADQNPNKALFSYIIDIHHTADCFIINFCEYLIQVFR